MFDLNEIQNKTKEIEQVFKVNGFNIETDFSYGITGCEGCSGSCSGTCDGSCKNYCQGCGSLLS